MTPDQKEAIAQIERAQKTLEAIVQGLELDSSCNQNRLGVARHHLNIGFNQLWRIFEIEC